jgi:pimeloyl-ACP methyl ester carboxylesterase
LGDRVAGAVTLAGIAPVTDDFDWSAGMVDHGGLRAAVEGREARARFAETEEFDPDSFIPADWAALAGPWESLGDDAQRGGVEFTEGLIDDDVAIAGPWGFDPAAVEPRVLIVQGGEDRVVPPSHADWLLHRCPRAELWLRPRDGHVSVLDASAVAMDASAVAMDWLLGLA